MSLSALASRLRRGGVPGVVAAAALALAAGCAATAETDSHQQEVQPIDRMLIGKAASYPADKTLREKTALFESSMAERRKAAWKIVEKALEPVRIAAEVATTDPASPEAQALELPRFQTWYSREDILPMFDHLFRDLSDADKTSRAPFPASAIDEVFPWNSTMATSLPSFTKERLEARKREIATAQGLASLGKGSRVLMSPAYVSHLLGSYGKIVDCNRTRTMVRPPAGEPSGEPAEASFAPCLDREFPAEAASIKARWMPSSSPIPTYDTSAAGLAAKLKSGTFGDGDGTATPDEKSIYTMRLNATTTSKLVALHITTKELRDWMWITLWWSPDPSSDFGADRPESLKGAFANYKMCVVTAFDEKDKAPGKSFADGQPSLAAALDVAAAEGPATWCSNPYLETQERAATTNCIGCHQHGGTGETADTVLEDPKKFPDFGRKKTRTTFPTDYGFTTDGGLELASEFRARIEALMPPPPPAPER